MVITFEACRVAQVKARLRLPSWADYKLLGSTLGAMALVYMCATGASPPPTPALACTYPPGLPSTCAVDYKPAFCPSLPLSTGCPLLLEWFQVEPQVG